MAEETTATLRRCIGSAKFGIEPHEAPIEDFPKQPSTRDGLGRMCRVHWTAYTRALRKAAQAGMGAEVESGPEGERMPAATPTATAPTRSRRPAATGVAGAQGDAG